MESRYGRINLIIGCMFSSKTSTLISHYKRYTIGGKKCIRVKHRRDTRYDDGSIVTHDGVRVDAINCLCLYEIDNMVRDYDVVCIDEIQFFKDAHIFCDKWANEGLIVEAYGLNGTSERTPFEVISKLIPLADNITFLNAICKDNGNDAIYSKRTTEEKGEIVIGGADKYCAVDREIFFNDRSLQRYHIDKFAEFMKIYMMQRYGEEEISQVLAKKCLEDLTRNMDLEDYSFSNPIDYKSILEKNLNQKLLD